MKVAVQYANGETSEPQAVGTQERVLVEAENGDVFYIDDVPDNAGSIRITCLQRSLALRPTARNVVDVSRA
jgi:hypothetical protein